MQSPGGVIREVFNFSIFLLVTAVKRGNPYPHRYKYGKIDKPIDLDIFKILLERVPKVDRSGYSTEVIQALLALLYWTGLRKTEVLGRKEIHYRVKAGFKIGKPHPGLLKEDMRLEDEALFVFSTGDKVLKHGKREAPLVLRLDLPYVDLIVERWRNTRPGSRVFPISYITFWRICKRVDPKFAPHFLRHNRVTKFSANPKLSLADICAWTGLSPQTVSTYMMRAGRYTKRTGDIMAEEILRAREQQTMHA
jgi:integrase